jgi:hypothetical protein
MSQETEFQMLSIPKSDTPINLEGIMIRRNFIKVMATGTSMFILPVGLSGCSSSKESSVKSVEADQGDIRLRLISHAMLAPNSHNIQPWLIKLVEKESFELYVDTDRLLPETDPPARQIHISQGTFLESLKIAGAEFGYEVLIDYFPVGMYSNQVIENKPIAHIRLVRNASSKKDPFFPYLKTRQSNKRNYNDRPLTDSLAKKIEISGTDDGFKSHVSISPDLIQALVPMLGESMAIETANSARHKETVDIFRFSEKEAEMSRDGFTVANNGITGFSRFIVESFFLGSRDKAYATDSTFAEEGIKMAYKQAESTPAFGWLVSEKNTRLDQVKAGQHYMRINLLTEQLGIALHPMSQILEEYQDMQDLQKKFKTLIGASESGTVQMLFRLGYADPIPHTKRRKLADVIL